MHTPTPAAQSAITLYRTSVVLPDSMACQPRQERIVFFEARSKNAGLHLEVLLGALWGVSTEDWLESGLIYNLWSEQELRDSTLDASGAIDESKGDTFLFETGFETGWPTDRAATGRTRYPKPSDIDMFVSPRTRARLDKAMQAIATSDKTRSAAAKHMLRRMQQDGRLAYLMDPLTTSYELLTAEVAAATGQDVESFRTAFEATLKYTPVSRG